MNKIRPINIIILQHMYLYHFQNLNKRPAKKCCQVTEEIVYGVRVTKNPYLIYTTYYIPQEERQRDLVI